MFGVIAVAALAVWGVGLSPIWVLVIAALLGIAWELAIVKRKGKQ